MKEHRRFDPRSIHKLNDPERFSRENPDLIWRELGLADPHVLVEIGAGTGFFAAPFARKMRNGRIYACDVQDEMLSWMSRNLPVDVRGSVRPLKMSETRVPLPDGIADLVYMINLHHELDDAAALMKESARLLKDGGTVLVMDWKKGETPAGPPQEIRVAEDRIISDLAGAGLRDVRPHAVMAYHTFVTGKK